MQPCISIRYIRTPGFISDAICWVNGSLVSHVEFGTPDGTWIGAHSPGGVQERPADYCKPVLEWIYDIPCTQDIQDAHLKRIRAQIGTHYNTLDILGILIRNRKLTSPGRVICSQFVSAEALILWWNRYLNLLHGWEYLVTPEMSHLSPILIGHRRK